MIAVATVIAVAAVAAVIAVAPVVAVRAVVRLGAPPVGCATVGGSRRACVEIGTWSGVGVVFRDPVGRSATHGSPPTLALGEPYPPRVYVQRPSGQ
jgi:hypothetical protein